MSYYFPTVINRTTTIDFQFSNWENTMNNSMPLRIEFALPSLMHRHRADTIAPSADMPFVDLGYFKDNEGKIEAIIQASEMEHEIALEDYFEFFTQMTKETIVQKRLIDNDPDKADILTEKTFPDGQTWITRRTAFKTWNENSAFVVILNFACNKEVYNDNADLFFYMMNSFRFINPPEYKLAERFRIVTKKYPLDFGTYLPFSWQEEKRHFDTTIEMQGYFKKIFRGNVSGICNINVVSINANKPQKKEDVLKKYLSAYLKNGLEFNSIIFEKLPDKGNRDFVSICDHEFSIQQGEQMINLNLKIYSCRAATNWLYIGMIGASKLQNFEVWAINKRTFNLAVQYLKTEIN